MDRDQVLAAVASAALALALATACGIKGPPHPPRHDTPPPTLPAHDATVPTGVDAGSPPPPSR